MKIARGTRVTPQYVQNHQKDGLWWDYERDRWWTCHHVPSDGSWTLDVALWPSEAAARIWYAAEYMQATATPPPAQQAELERYVDAGTPTGDFLRAVLEDRLVAAVGAADAHNVALLHVYATYLYRHVPMGARGPENVLKWIAAGGLKGKIAKAASEVK